jgi:hypothetical protein
MNFCYFFFFANNIAEKRLTDRINQKLQKIDFL